MTQVVEEWKPVVGFAKYEVSSLGRIRNAESKRILAAYPNKKGYLCIGLTDCEHRTKTRKVHSLVIQSFVGPRPPGLEVNHIDADKKNCRVENLEYVTHATNIHHAHSLGRLSWGSPRLCWADLKQIRAMKGLMSQRDIGHLFGITPQYVGRIQGGYKPGYLL